MLKSYEPEKLLHLIKERKYSVNAIAKEMKVSSSGLLKSIKNGTITFEKMTQVLKIIGMHEYSVPEEIMIVSEPETEYKKLPQFQSTDKIYELENYIKTLKERIKQLEDDKSWLKKIYEDLLKEKNI